MSKTNRHIEQAKMRKGIGPAKKFFKKKHGNPLKGCDCMLCRIGLRTVFGDVQATKANRSFRRQAKASLKNGKLPAEKISIGYTD